MNFATAMMVTIIQPCWNILLRRYIAIDKVIVLVAGCSKPDWTRSLVSQRWVGTADFGDFPGSLTGYDSYLIIPNFLSTEETEALLDRAKQLLDEFNIDDHPRVRISVELVFFTGTQCRIHS
jgi:hypothetical protein